MLLKKTNLHASTSRAAGHAPIIDWGKVAERNVIILDQGVESQFYMILTLP
jgi:hypothetical protein